MELCNNIMTIAVKRGKAFNNFTGSISKKSRFYIIPLAGNAVEFIGFPEFGKYLILLAEIRSKIYKNNNRFPGNIPSACFDS